jgi:nucleotide-binding universal stress UspA family protein
MNLPIHEATMYRSILVPLDGSTFGEHAVPWAATIARRAGAKMTLAHVHEPASVLYGEGAVMLSDELDTHARGQKQLYLDHVVGRLYGGAAMTAEARMLEGGVVEAIHEYVNKNHIDLVVMTTHGRGPMGRFWLGSAADKLVRRLNVPLLLVHPAATTPDLTEERAVHHILIPLDGSELAEGIITPATSLGESMQSDYTLLRVVRPVHPTLPYTEGLSVAQMAGEILDRIETLQGEVLKEAQGYLTGVAEKLRARSIGVRTRVAVEEHPASAILQEAGTCGADLIAIETHGRGGLIRLVLGSVADKVLRGSTIPVLVHHPSGEAKT